MAAFRKQVSREDPEGKCCIALEDGKTIFTLTSDTLLALSSSTRAYFQVHKPIRMIVISVPALPGIQPSPYFLSLNSILGTEREVNFSRGYSRRFLIQSDGFNISVNNTVPNTNNQYSMQYRNHIEASLFFRGRGTYLWNNNMDSLEFNDKDPEKKDGIMYLLDKHDPHLVVIEEEYSEFIGIFFPALKGDEVHNFDDDSQMSSY